MATFGSFLGWSVVSTRSPVEYQWNHKIIILYWFDITTESAAMLDHLNW